MSSVDRHWGWARGLELLFLVLWIAPVILIWVQWTGDSSESVVSERQLGAEVILTQLNGIVTGASIIIAGIGIFAGLTAGRGLESRVFRPLRYAGVWAVITLLVALYDMALVPSVVTEENPVKVLRVSVLAAIALGLAFLSAAWFVRSIWVATKL